MRILPQASASMTTKVRAVQKMPRPDVAGRRPATNTTTSWIDQVGGEDREGYPDQPHRPGLPLLVDAFELPDHDEGGEDLDQ